MPLMNRGSRILGKDHPFARRALKSAMGKPDRHPTNLPPCGRSTTPRRLANDSARIDPRQTISPTGYLLVDYRVIR